ncbi:hypothetical protein DSM106972_028030 [Dulcicalothrix desertica PCC 7102]|uniref:Uncharacterized protein n=1 Tax=Dulcicalothrix desertica PCC 7102 TaxID=232991 RepID=A0A3S1AQ87_9CYAN|nr:hypothetical protein [Dulcicalothrix desertica]RUT06546.1 hypothetical protein DSM106972_028030 [Dulcicalothrix desertica PCC 7102]TWH50339.1 hypothetical protein CAL7102_04638 [Dulcicalothrix desertica PCC 7102]
MNLKTIVTTAALTGLVTIGASLSAINLQSNQAVAKETNGMMTETQRSAQAEAMKDVTGLTPGQKIAMLTKHKGMFGSGDELRRYFFGDLEPIAVQPGGAGMVVNLYNKANNTTFAYCATYDVVVAVKQGKITAFAPSEVK